MFGFTYDSDSSVNEITTSFEGFGIKTKPPRVFGFRNAKVKLFLQTTKSDDREEVTKNVIPTYNEYETVQTLVFVENSDRQAGTYFCVATCSDGEKVFKVEKRRTMFLS
ncbi:Hypothetical predicted protein [Mytilus galloprovincialis]|uniref:Uncharacterized protein n=1 Tax=Mytilus galloprovincialis TaxID=29158 RepID=A0A8B6CJJ6_MYTGA|nr:Hypothetical predicted protein [Mytilus galloprovincialis]